MAIEQFANGAQTTLNGSINNSVTSLVVTSAALFPTVGNFRLYIGTEILLVTAVSGTTFTVTRGVEGSTAASHTSGDTVTLIGTAASLRNVSPWCNVKQPPVVASWTAVNQGGATLTDLDWGVRLEIPSGAGDNNRGWVRNIPAQPYTVTALFTPYWSGETFARQGIFLYDGTKLITHGWDSAGSTTQQFFSVHEWTNVTTFSGQITTGQDIYNNSTISWRDDMPTWFRIRDDGTTLHFEVSKDFMFWWTISTLGRTAFLTATKIGIFCNGFGSSKKNGLSLLSWDEG